MYSFFVNLPYICSIDLKKLIIKYHDRADEENIILLSKALYLQLGQIKSKIETDLAGWERYKKVTNPYEYINTVVPHMKQPICSLKPLSRSFYKMIELCHATQLLAPWQQLPSIQTFHLAEGPGGFIEAMTYLRRNPADLYYGMTLMEETNIDVPGWRRSRAFLANNPNVKIEVGEDGTGNLLHSVNLQKCKEKYFNSMDLVTADGGFDFSLDYPSQERVSAKLIFAQIAFALCTQKVGGTFIIKFFDTFSRISLELLYLLAATYDKVTIIKPETSRMANSEKYIVCKGFHSVNLDLNCLIQALDEFSLPNQGELKSIFSFELPAFFLNQIEESNIVLGQQQIENISNTLQLMQLGRNEKQDQLRNQHVQKCVEWCQLHEMPFNRPTTFGIHHNNNNNYSNNYSNNIFMHRNKQHHHFQSNTKHRCMFVPKLKTDLKDK